MGKNPVPASQIQACPISIIKKWKKFKKTVDWNGRRDLFIGEGDNNVSQDIKVSIHLQ